MKNRSKVRESKSLLRLLVYILLVITLLLFIVAGVRIRGYSRGYQYNYKASDFIYDAEKDRFGRLYTTAISDMERDASYDSDVQEFRALGFYYEQAVLEKAYRDAGMTEKADAFKAKKEEYGEALGSLASKVSAVEKSLNR